MTMEIRSVLLWIPDYVTQVFDADLIVSNINVG